MMEMPYFKHSLVSLHPAAENDDKTILVSSPDTDVFVFLLRYAQSINSFILFDTGVANHRRLLKVNEIIERIGEILCKALTGLYSFTGCFTTSAFVPRGD
jgi:hypothetical protein